MLEVVKRYGNGVPASVILAALPDGTLIECAESVQPPVPRSKKWVVTVSTLKGCPVKCPICDAGGDYQGRLSANNILDQIDLLIGERFPGGRVPCKQFKIQFARMGDPALNGAVLEVLSQLPTRYRAPGLMPSISTIAPAGREHFFEELFEIKEQYYRHGRFQLQFSLHTTDEKRRGELIPARTWSYAGMGEYGRMFSRPGDRKVTLNFAPVEGFPLEPGSLRKHFTPEKFLIKLTPVNPTFSSALSGLRGLIDPEDEEGARAVADRFRVQGYETILSIGDLRENDIGSNCGMYLKRAEAGIGDMSIHP